MLPKEQEERVAQEKEWHNQTYGTDVRSSTQKYYAVLKKEGGIAGFRDQLVLENADPESCVFLDYGCGDGRYLASMANHFKSGVGIDISDSRIESAKAFAKESGIDNAAFHVMDAMNTTFEDSTFDIITGNAILHHLDLTVSLNEIKRILKPDGKAYFIEPLATNPIIELYRKLTPKKRTVDEQPFRSRELRLVKSIFPETEMDYFGCFALLAVPFRNSKRFDKISAFLERVDKRFLGRKSPFKKLAWCCLLTLKGK